MKLSIVKPKKPLASKISEHQLQASIFSYVNKVLPALRPFMFAIPNGGQRNVIVAKKLKAEGVTAGVWDILIVIPNIYKHGLFIECKVSKNELTKTQQDFKEKVQPVGYHFEECRSLEDFIAILENYFELKLLSNKEIISRIKAETFVQKGFGDRGLC
jgi:hypothetical protein